MPSQTNEQALESALEKRLTGTCREEILEQKESTFGEPVDLATERAELYRGGNGYFIGSPNDFNARFAIDELRFWNFLETTQKEELAKLQKQSDWKLKILERLDRMIKKYGIIRLLKKGLEVDDAQFIFLYVLPMASSSEQVKRNFESNQFSVTRQVRYSLISPKEQIDMVLFVNGIADLIDKRFAVIIDEAHSSQSGSAADNLNRAMGNNGHEEEDPDPQDKILEAMRSSKMRDKR